MSDQEQNGSQESDHSTNEIPDLGGLHFTEDSVPQTAPQQPVTEDQTHPTEQIPLTDQSQPADHAVNAAYPATEQPAADDPFAVIPASPSPQAAEDPLAGQPGQAGPDGTAPSQPKKANKAVIAGAAAGLIAGLIGGVAGAGATGMFNSGSVAVGNQLNPVNPEGLSPRADNSIAAIAEAVTPSVVSIKVVTGTSGGTGTGFVISDDGYIMTNNHVVASAVQGGKITVSFKDESSAEARIVGRSPAYDIAVIKVDKSGLHPVTLGNSASVVVGDAAVAIGSPLGLEGTVTSGIISAVRRPVTAGGSGEATHISALQTDAAINPGNSGGPLVNAEGQVIGVNSSIATMGQTENGSSSSGSIGLGFAIPINNAKRVADEIIASGESKVPIIGVQVNMETPDQGGALITGVTQNGPGAQAGLKEGDRIVDIDGDKIADPAEGLAVIRSHHPGDTIKVTVVTQSGETKTVDVKLSSMVG